LTETYGNLVLTLPGGQEVAFALSEGSVTIGRATHNDIVLSDSKVSRVHAHLECSGAGCTLSDAGSVNGTFVNGARVERAALAAGDTISLGDSTLRLEIAHPRRRLDVTRIDTEADLDATFKRTTLSMTLSDTRSSRLAIYVPGKTWEVPLTQDALIIGRHAKNDIALNDPKVSRHHARIERRGNAFLIRDLSSTNGCWLGRQRIEEYVLQDGDTIRIGSAQLVFKRGFTPEALTLVDAPKSVYHRTLHPVVIVPGFMGSELWRGSERIWPNPRYMVTHPDVFRMSENNPIEARGVVNESVIIPNLITQEQYNRLGDYLAESLGYVRGKDLLEFGYDWRQDLRLSARRLGEAIEAWQSSSKEAQGPVTIIAHSMGCLVVRYYVERLGGRGRVGRLILIGGPHGGAPRTLEAFAFGQKPLFLGRLAERFQRVVVSFPSIYTILPTAACVYDAGGQSIDLYGDESWALPECQPHIANARSFRRELGHRSSVPTVCVFGYGVKTIVRVQVEEGASGRWGKVRFIRKDRGDNMIPEDSAVIEGMEIHPVHQHHGSLYVDNDVKMRLKLELMR
jgi:pSer/pThr/pTyr-binding forkhead associated (FHA) protein